MPRKPKTASTPPEVASKKEDVSNDETTRDDDLSAQAAALMAEPVERTPEQSRAALRRKVQLFYDLQELRIATADRGMKKEGGNQIELHPVDVLLFNMRAKELKRSEKAALKDIEEHLRTLPVYNQLFVAEKDRFRGVGPTMAGVLLSEFDIHQAVTPSQFVSFAGLAPVPCRRCKACHWVLDEPKGEDEGVYAHPKGKAKCRFVGVKGKITKPAIPSVELAFEVLEVFKMNIDEAILAAPSMAISLDVYSSQGFLGPKYYAIPWFVAERAIAAWRVIGETEPLVIERQLLTDVAKQLERQRAKPPRSAVQKARATEGQPPFLNPNHVEYIGEMPTYASGRAARPVAGQRLPYNKWLRTKMVGVLAEVLLKARSPWRKFYDDYKHRKASISWGKSDGHRHMAAKRYMIKMLLAEIWGRWREIEGLPTRPLYGEEYLKHTHHEERPKPPPRKRREDDEEDPMLMNAVRAEMEVLDDEDDDDDADNDDE